LQFSEGRHEDAVRHFDACIALEPSDAVFWSNRAAAKLALRDWAGAFADARQATVLKPDWAKGWARWGAAATGAGELTTASESYAQAAKLEPSNAEYARSRDAAMAAEAAALAKGEFKFRPTGKRPASTAARIESKGAKLRPGVLLSFGDDEEVAE